MRVKCLAQEHDTTSLARGQTQTACSGVKRTNHEATVPPTSLKQVKLSLLIKTATVTVNQEAEDGWGRAVTQYSNLLFFISGRYCKFLLYPLHLLKKINFMLVKICSFEERLLHVK